ncbi:hypothetical protein Csp2054_08135 [Curtobacterium sp. 'Ferrero']|uniref:DUF4259 domain-containing protein n=1 Tax=Curtobacterium sp. 'Ferrero' TaxID=2033654 RepID=UPI000BC6A6BC|nr:DUF4259 domain-containing protein [Curtobacterium sp. 'Ferrero']PCN48119.1 hypothetical protein Csp2054_08135 [Curtobacterium sp. 'Ferrero']
MGTWSAEPIGNDTAADFVAELGGQKRWTLVRAALRVAWGANALDSDVAAAAIAAAEVVAHGLGRPTQSDAYTDEIERFVGRARRPSRRLADRAARTVEFAARPDGELAELWAKADADASAWYDAIARLVITLEQR